MTIRELIANGTITMETKVLGTLPMTADWALLTLNGNFYFNGGTSIPVAAGILEMMLTEDEDNLIVVRYRDEDGEEDVLYANQCYSTSAAALAAKGGGK